MRYIVGAGAQAGVDQKDVMAAARRSGAEQAGDGSADREGYATSRRMVLVGAEGEVAGLDLVEGVRLAALLPLERAADHVEKMARLDILWLVLKPEHQADLVPALLKAALGHGCAIICETDLERLDTLQSMMPETLGAQILLKPTVLERSAALIRAQWVRPMALHDPERNDAMERIDQLQEEVLRISRLLENLTNLGEGRSAAEELAAPNPGGGRADQADQLRSPPRSYRPMMRKPTLDEDISDRDKAKRARRLIRQRRAREQYFPADLFADPAWDMLLDLYAARLERQPVAVSSLCIAAAVPATTALRWIKTMTDTGIFVREADARDGRRIFIGLSDRAFYSLERYFEALED